jgi:hypothetical protein
MAYPRKAPPLAMGISGITALISILVIVGSLHVLLNWDPSQSQPAHALLHAILNCAGAILGLVAAFLLQTMRFAAAKLFAVKFVFGMAIDIYFIGIVPDGLMLHARSMRAFPWIMLLGILLALARLMYVWRITSPAAPEAIS